MTKHRALGDRELDIMQELWSHGPATVATVHRGLQDKGVVLTYNTVQTMLNRLQGKGIVARDTAERAHRYAALTPEQAFVGGAVRSLAARFFAGSAAELVSRLVETELSPQEVKRLERLIREQEGHRRG